VRKNTGQSYEVWFASRTEYAEANARRLEEEARKRGEEEAKATKPTKEQSQGKTGQENDNK
jgi:hypothetical protein